MESDYAISLAVLHNTNLRYPAYLPDNCDEMDYWGLMWVIHNDCYLPRGLCSPATGLVEGSDLEALRWTSLAPL